MEIRDYYAELGVKPDAGDKEIKQAYRKLARENHPDVKPGDQQAEARFKAINEAYQTLGDPEKRKQYDTLRQQYQQWQHNGGVNAGYGWPNGAGGAGGAGGRVYSSGNLSPEDLEELFGDGAPFADIFGSMFGQGGRTADPRPHRGRDIETLVEVTLEEALHGTSRMIHAGEQRIEARIPPGVQTNSRIRLSGQGQPGLAGGPAGDLYLVIEVLPHPQFAREGNDLHTEVPVDIYTAAIGGEARVQTLDGSIKLKIPPRTQADKLFRLRKQGMPRLDKPDERGDLYARVKLVLPEDLDDNELDTLRDLAQNRQYSYAQV